MRESLSRAFNQAILVALRGSATVSRVVGSLAGVIDVEADDLAAGGQVHLQAVDDLPGFGAGLSLEFDCEAIRLRIAANLLSCFSRNRPDRRI